MDCAVFVRFYKARTRICCEFAVKVVVVVVVDKNCALAKNNKLYFLTEFNLNNRVISFRSSNKHKICRYVIFCIKLDFPRICNHIFKVMLFQHFPKNYSRHILKCSHNLLAATATRGMAGEPPRVEKSMNC